MHKNLKSYEKCINTWDEYKRMILKIIPNMQQIDKFRHAAPGQCLYGKILPAIDKIYEVSKDTDPDNYILYYKLLRGSIWYRPWAIERQIASLPFGTEKCAILLAIFVMTHERKHSTQAPAMLEPIDEYIAITRVGGNRYNNHPTELDANDAAYKAMKYYSDTGEINLDQ